MKHQARKRFGQHFLADAFVVDRIVDLIDPLPGQALVEIGPGLGALTWPLLRRCQALTVIELDRDLAERLRSQPTLTVIEADVLAVDIAALPRPTGQLLRLVGNLPYNISTPILFHLLEAADQVADQHVMLQREVAQRMVATPGHKAYGRLSVMLQWRYHIECVLEVPPQAFDPPPEVHSTVVRMLPLPTAAQPGGLLSELVRVAFSQRRKLLRHTLGRWLEAHGMDAAGFDLQRRAEEVPVAQYVELAQLAARSTQK